MSFTRSFKTTLVAVLALGFSVALSACDSGGTQVVIPPPGDPGPTAASFPIASQVVTLADGSQGLQFAVTPAENVQLVRVDIKNPLGTTATFNANNNVALAGVSFALQDPGFAYFRVSGTWSFTFIGTRAAGDKASFSVAVPLSVGARPAPSN